MSGIVLDAGALIALERNDRMMWTTLKHSASRGEDVIVPSTVLAQVWRRRPGQAIPARAVARHRPVPRGRPAWQTASHGSASRPGLPGVGGPCGRLPLHPRKPDQRALTSWTWSVSRLS